VEQANATTGIVSRFHSFNPGNLLNASYALQQFCPRPRASWHMTGTRSGI
jgi:hypothetical protein